MAVADALDVAGRVEFSVAVNGDVCHAQVNAQGVVHVNRVRVFNVAGSEQVELATMKNEVAFSLPRLEQFQLARSGYKGNGQTALDRPDGHLAPIELPLENPVIVGDGTERTKDALALSVELVGIPDFGKATDYDLSRKVEPLSQRSRWPFAKHTCRKSRAPRRSR